jgi:hypothetical protein
MSKNILDSLETIVENSQKVYKQIEEGYVTQNEFVNNLMLNFNVCKLWPGETFEIESNMACMLIGGGKDCVKYYKKSTSAGVDGDPALSENPNLDMAVFFAVDINKRSDPGLASKYYDQWYRVVCAHGSKNTFGIPSGDLKVNRMDKGAYLKNTIDPKNIPADKGDDSVQIYYIKQGKHSIENETV